MIEVDIDARIERMDKKSFEQMSEAATSKFRKTENVMESLVKAEVRRQVEAVSPRLAAYLNPDELMTYALNRLPPLYASSQEGLEHQLKRGKVQLKQKIVQAVQWAIAAVQNDPLRSRTPLTSSSDPHQSALQQIRNLLQDDTLEWDTLPAAVEKALRQSSQRHPGQGPSGQGASFIGRRREVSWPEYKRLRKSKQQNKPWESSFYPL